MKVHGIYVQRKVLGLNLVSSLYYVPKCKCKVYYIIFQTRERRRLFELISSLHVKNICTPFNLETCNSQNSFEGETTMWLYFNKLRCGSMEGNESLKEPMALCVHLINTKICWENQCTYHDKMWWNVMLCSSWMFIFFDNLTLPCSNCH